MKKSLTPAQSYAERIINAIDDNKDINYIMSIVSERPTTLRSAMNMYLYKSINRT